MEPMKPQQKTVRALVPRKHREVRGPTSEWGGSDLHDASPKEVLNTREVLSFLRIHNKCVGLTLYGLGVHFGDEDPQAVQARQLLGRKVHGTESDA